MTRTGAGTRKRAKTRTHLSVDSALLEHAMQFFETESKSDAVNEALAFFARAIAFDEMVAIAKAGAFDSLIQSEDDSA